MSRSFSRKLIITGLAALLSVLICPFVQAAEKGADLPTSFEPDDFRNSQRSDSGLLPYPELGSSENEGLGQLELNLELPAPAQPDACWHELIERLAADGLDRQWLEQAFSRLADGFNAAPMKIKLQELYRIKFGKKNKPGQDGAKQKARYLPDVLTEGNYRRCAEYLEQHMDIFLLAEAEYGVPKEVAVSLLMVETRLGAYMGRQSALRNLASLAASTRRETFYPYLPSVAGNRQKEEWMQSVLDKRSKWAYNELKHLLSYARANGVDPAGIQGSIYGAVGYCQFMPSNVPVFGADGNNDGKINLFEPADAIFSLSNYLHVHGWTAKAGAAKQRKALLAYNRSSAYANTILKMAEEVRALRNAEAENSTRNKDAI
ncbi:MAG: lytic murein transglycosylase [Desulfovibrionaceae bacterium]|nr:lytic murein transglycosylase [Desulfovibrionaceae bacterium]